MCGPVALHDGLDRGLDGGQCRIELLVVARGSRSADALECTTELVNQRLLLTLECRAGSVELALSCFAVPLQGFGYRLLGLHVRLELLDGGGQGVECALRCGCVLCGLDLLVHGEECRKLGCPGSVLRESVGSECHGRCASPKCLERNGALFDAATSLVDHGGGAHETLGSSCRICRIRGVPRGG